LVQEYLSWQPIEKKVNAAKFSSTEKALSRGPMKKRRDTIAVNVYPNKGYIV